MTSETLCPECGERVHEPGALCPHCGASLSSEDDETPTRGRRRLWMRLLLTLLGLALFVGVLAASAYAGIYVGERDRQTRREAVVESHYRAGIEALNEGNHERAVAEFKYVLQLNPDHRLAEQGLVEANTRLVVKPTPTLEAAISLAEQLLIQAEASYEEEDWVSTARTLTQLRALDPDYEQASVEELLFVSLYNAGTHYLGEDNLEVGISYLDQAIALRPLDADAVNQRNLAARYLDALNYWGVDWELCIERLKALHALAPDYKDVTQRIYRAYIAYGDTLIAQGESCPAEMQYSQALRMFSASELEDKRADAAQTCLVATPVAVSGTLPINTPQPIEGFARGRLAYPVYNNQMGTILLYALYADGRIIRVADGADQPSWEWNTGRMVYRDRTTNAIRLILPEEGVPLDLLPPDGQAWPTLSPDSRRLAYAVAGADGTWSVVIANTDGTGEPRRVGAGWAPTWGRQGLLAYTGCGSDGSCGIILDNPDDDQPGTRLTGSEQDTAVSWAPDGNSLAYMSNVTGNWDLFLLSPEGGVQQLTSESSDEGLPVWSPDGSQIAFISNRNGGWAIYVMPAGGGPAKRLLDLGATFPGWENQRLSWAP